MEISTTHPKQTVLAKPGSSPDQKKRAASDEGAEKNKQITDDSVLLSKESVALSQSSTVQGGVKLTPIENSEQAQKTVAQVVSAIRDDPEAAKQIHGNISQVKLKLLLE